jgi:hypothetical protein
MADAPFLSILDIDLNSVISTMATHTLEIVVNPHEGRRPVLR